MSDKIPKNPFKFGLYASKPYKGWVFAALFFVFIATAIDRYLVVVLKNLTDAISQNTDFNNIWFWAIAYPVLHFIGRNLWRGSGFTGMRWFMWLRSTGYQSLYEYLTLHSKDYFNSKFAGALTNKVTNAVEGSERLYEKTLWQFYPILLGLIIYIVISSIADFRFGLIVFFWSVIFLGVNAYLSRKLQRYSFRFAKSLSSLKGKIVDSLSNISLVHENAYVSGERAYIKKYIDEQTEAGLSHWFFSEWILVINGAMIFLFMCFMTWTSIYLFQNQIITLGVIIMVLAIVLDLSQAFFFIGQEMKEGARNFGEAREGLEEILSKHIIVDSPAAIDFMISKGEISVESIDFNYENTKVFRNFSLKISAGQKVGLVGKSGAGKTTFVALLLRHFDISAGEIKIDGQNISGVTLESLRRAIAFVPQDTSLFHRSIKENIGYSNPGASDAKIFAAAKQAQAHEFIKALPQGYETLVGERGVKLSGGQRQRVAIARAFLKNAPILILDEATSSLDSESEYAIQVSLDKLMRGRTVIAIAHRLSTLKKMDRIVFIEDGKIIEDGTPEELLKRPQGSFKKMWDHQVKGFIVDE
ncbi:ABC transporter ATP-binding protein [Candidatus Daviesbacteria bacterium]|nr:ABC transporter ATP-binding protein [Candidatus Daviesbacteria bacterium]